MRPRRLLQLLIFIAADLAISALALGIGARYGWIHESVSGVRLALHLGLILALLQFGWNYRLEKSDGTEEFVHLLKSMLLYYAVFLAAITMGREPAGRPALNYALFVLLLLLSLQAERFVLRRLLFRLRLFRSRLLIFGAGEMGRIFLEAARANVYLNYEIVGLIDDDPGKRGASLAGVEVLGGSERLDDLVEELRVDRVIVAIPTLTRDRLLDFLVRFKRIDVDIEVIPDLFGIATANFQLVAGIPLISSEIEIITGVAAIAKRAIDLAGATAALVLFSPILAVSALLIRLESPGPAIFMQERLGRNGKNFMVYKFRSMFVDAEAWLASLLAKNPTIRAEYEKFAKITGDPRITRVGAILRKFSIDEFPQLLNVFRGEMSLVGPRPYLVSEGEKLGESKETILSVKPGVTGLWQIRGRNELTFRERVRLEAFYVRRWSPGLDLWILLSTLPVVLFRRGAK